MISITLNGSQEQFPDGATLAEVVQHITSATQGIAVAVDAHVIRRTEWASTALHPGAQVDVLTAVQGG
ncbi:MAG: sulfur carrier protein ThiS [Actinobacteria bacterium]|nr:MAG: sulfur carrier protein ThiS [Actinomycetota bacterium]